MIWPKAADDAADELLAAVLALPKWWRGMQRQEPNRVVFSTWMSLFVFKQS
jgi:hypothetical protein